MKNTILLTSLVLAASAASVSAQEAAKNVTVDPFVRVDAVYAKAPLEFPVIEFEDDYSFGGGLTFGAMVNDRHELSVSVSGNQWEVEPLVLPGTVRTEITYTQVPVLLNYRYHLPVAKGFTIFAGPSLGFSYEESEITNIQLGALSPNLVGTTSEDYLSFTYGASVGFTVEIGKGWSLTGLAAYTKVSGSPDVNFPGQNIGPEMKHEAAPSFKFSVGYSW